MNLKISWGLMVWGYRSQAKRIYLDKDHTNRRNKTPTNAPKPIEYPKLSLILFQKPFTRTRDNEQPISRLSA